MIPSGDVNVVKEFRLGKHRSSSSPYLTDARIGVLCGTPSPPISTGGLVSWSNAMRPRDPPEPNSRAVERGVGMGAKQPSI